MKNSPKIDKEYYFISGLPRSGSTLLCNILAQNPDFHTTGTSGIMDVIFGVRNQWDNLIEFKASPNPDAKLRVMRGILENYFSDTDKPVVFDKCRGWLSLIEMAEFILGHKAKIIVPVRDIRDVLASFEKLWRENSAENQNMGEAQDYFRFQTVKGRVNYWMQDNQPTGLAYNRIVDALQRGFADRMLFVRFEDLTTNPKQTMQDIYKFLGKDYFEHDFNNIEQVTFEDDSIHGFKNLHQIRKQVRPVESSWEKVLGKFAEPYGNLNFWNK